MICNLRRILIFFTLLTPLAALAQANHAITRAEVRDDFIRVQQAGYQTTDWVHYPENMQAAESRIAKGDKTPSITSQAGDAGQTVSR